MFKPVHITLAGYYLVIIVPDISVNTAQAYSRIKPQKSRESLNKIINLPIQEWRYELYNDFEYVIFKIHPEIASIKEALYRQGAIYASMSGSGSAVYGIFEEAPALDGFDKYFIWQEKCQI
ncbi:MAG: 4-diphosphocytidyl-2-C-methyl-D-erythritol kinase [Bacteroidetes bacterium ADurb.Bin408]|nr:MAG: 4-diphosphocytidyl-2-C-methyl-D-erythritol kinase [Bacteroidetes bacterium ADurb.Bin408]